MKKRQWIILIILVVIVGIGAAYFLYIKDSGQSKTEVGCQDFIDECYKKNFEFYAGGGHMFEVYPDGSTSLDDKANCPQDCSRYTEERGYFKDKKRQKKYYDNKVKECKKEYKKCLKNSDKSSIYEECHECNKYGEPIYLWN